MSAKWIRSKQWDDQHIPSWAWPLKLLLRAFSSIPLAVTLLSCVVLYATMASVPVGLIALGPTYALYGLTLLGVVAIGAVVPAAALWRLMRPRTGVGLRFAATVLLLVALVGSCGWLWAKFLWPSLQYDAVQHTGVRLFAGFVNRYYSTTLRRLPGMEMSELEFYGWWPLRVILVLFILNMVTATVRRIEFTFPHLGVLTVHTGIVTVALGSLYYHGLKQEGDTLLWGGRDAAPDGKPTIGPPQGGFYDNTRVALWAREGESDWGQRPIQVPRYNDYNLEAGGGLTAATIVGRGGSAGDDEGRTLNGPVAEPPAGASGLDKDLSFRIVGYASYADPVSDFVQAPIPPSGKTNPLRFVSLHGTATGEHGSEYAFYFLPDSPAGRVSEFRDDNGRAIFALEYTRGMPAQRWNDLCESLPVGARHALVVDVPGKDGAAPEHGVYAVQAGTTLEVGKSGYKIQVKELDPTPPFPIITEGYRGASSSVAVVRISTPEGKSYDRWVYHRFPEISQDLLDEKNERGMPKRRDADPAIRLSYLDASTFQVYMDEHADGTVRGCVRLPAGPARTFDHVQERGVVEEVLPRKDAAKDPKVDLVFGARWAHAEAFEHPSVVAPTKRDKSAIGTHEHAMLAIEVTAGQSKRIVWLPFTKYIGVNMGTERTIKLDDGRSLSLAFGRLNHRFPDFLIQLVDFEMIAYDHRGAPRDYQSIIRVVPVHDGSGPLPFQTYEHVTKLNAPLQAPFEWSDDRSYLANVFGQFASRLSPRQFKLSQAGWDAEGWRQTQQLADEGKLPRAYAGFTILGVGNNPGIHVIAAGAILVSIGIPWAFYIKPLIVRRRKAKLQAQVAAGTYRKPGVPERDPGDKHVQGREAIGVGQ